MSLEPLEQEHKLWKIIVCSSVMMVTSLFIAVALLTYNSADPSPNHAADFVVRNWAGAAGAMIADPLLQFIGLSSALLAIAPAIWGMRMAVKRVFPKLWLRLPLLLIAITAIAAIFAVLPQPTNWSFMTLGGFIGEFVRVELTALVGETIFFVSVITISVVSAIFALGVTVGEALAALRAVVKTIGTLYRSVRMMFRVTKSLVTKLRGGEAEEDIDIKEEKNIVEIKEKAPRKPKEVPVAAKQRSLKLSEADFELPDLDLLTAAPKVRKNGVSESALSQNARLLEKVLADFGVQGEISKVRPGPVVTLYELEPSAGTKSSRVIGLADDIARSMSAVSARIAVIPGRNAIGIELPNATRETVYLRELLEANEYKDDKLSLPLVLGKDIGGDPIIADLAKMPHLLVAGTTGSGKSVAINDMIISLLYRLTPEQCRFIMIDPKMLELSVYDGIPHLLSPVVTEPGKAVVALKWVVREMENRYRLMSTLGVRNIAGYNKRIEEAVRKGEVLERTVQTGFEPDTGRPIMEKQPLDMNKLPFIVVIVDEMADLMLVAGKDIEGAIQRLAQMARAAGIHIIMATQRPSVDVITGVIKANFPTRISFQVTSRIDSRTILGEMGAEQLLGMGDMLYMAGGSRITRVHGPFVSDKEVEDIVSFLKTQSTPSYVEEVTEDQNDGGSFIPGFSSAGGGENDSDNALYDQAVAIVIRDKKASTSYVQRQLRIGYNRAANLIERMEEEGVISRPNHSGKREILVGENA